jgi:hypothetical protein
LEPALRLPTKQALTLVAETIFFLALIVLWAGIRAVEATFKLHGRFAVDLEPQVNEP